MRKKTEGLSRLWTFFGRKFCKILTYNRLPIPAIGLNTPLQELVTDCMSKDCENRAEKCTKPRLYQRRMAMTLIEIFASMTLLALLGSLIAFKAVDILRRNSEDHALFKLQHLISEAMEKSILVHTNQPLHLYNIESGIQFEGKDKKAEIAHLRLKKSPLTIPTPQICKAAVQLVFGVESDSGHSYLIQIDSASYPYLHVKSAE